MSIIAKINKEELEKLGKSIDSELVKYRKELKINMFRVLQILDAAIKQNIRVRSGLHVRSGTLLNSIMIQVLEVGNNIVGQIGPSNVPYAAVQEFGHTFPARFIKPRNAKVLHWVANGKHFFSKGHELPAFRVPARPYMRPALEEQRERIAEKFGIFLSATFKFKGE
jgi:phage gpG-like protein